MSQITERTSSRFSDNLKLVIGGTVLTGLMIIISEISLEFRYESNQPKPIPLMVTLFLLSSAIYLFMLHLIPRLRSTGNPTGIIWFFAILMRLALLFSTPILELDIYRYMWDGQVVSHGHSPYEFSPQEVLDYSALSDTGLDQKNLARISEIKNGSKSIQTILSRVHFPEITTIYPPVSQAIFAISAYCTPDSNSASAYLLIMKFGIVIFDFLTIFGIQKLLLKLGYSRCWLLAYAWCPLVLKEFANSGHLDSIAVCFMVWSIYFYLGSIFVPKNRPKTKKRLMDSPQTLLAPLMLALSVGAKLFSIILLPIFFVLIWKKNSLKQACFSAGLTVILSTLICYPMFSNKLAPSKKASLQETITNNNILTDPTPPLFDNEIDDAKFNDGELSSETEAIQKTGIKEFLSHWEMNDFLFMLINENLKLDQEDNKTPWFSIVPEKFRTSSTTDKTQTEIIDQQHNSFLISRAITLLIFTSIVFWLCYRLWKQTTEEILLESLFLTLTWFFLLAPTQNPWYWTWALPLIPFARNKTWYYLAGLLFIYYLRFWFISQWKTIPVAGFSYIGSDFFDFIIVWLEYAPWFLLLMMSYFLKRKHPENESKLSGFETPQ